MIKKTVKYYSKNVSKIKDIYSSNYQTIKVTTYWLFWCMPIFQSSEVIDGKPEVR